MAQPLSRAQAFVVGAAVPVPPLVSASETARVSERERRLSEASGEIADRVIEGEGGIVLAGWEVVSEEEKKK